MSFNPDIARTHTRTHTHTLWQVKDEGRDPAERGFAEQGRASAWDPLTAGTEVVACRQKEPLQSLLPSPVLPAPPGSGRQRRDPWRGQPLSAVENLSS